MEDQIPAAVRQMFEDQKAKREAMEEAFGQLMAEAAGDNETMLTVLTQLFKSVMSLTDLVQQVNIELTLLKAEVNKEEEAKLVVVRNPLTVPPPGGGRVDQNVENLCDKKWTGQDS